MNFLQSLNLNDWITLGVIVLLLFMAMGAACYIAHNRGKRSGYTNGHADGLRDTWASYAGKVKLRGQFTTRPRLRKGEAFSFKGGLFTIMEMEYSDVPRKPLSAVLIVAHPITDGDGSDSRN